MDVEILFQSTNIYDKFLILCKNLYLPLSSYVWVTMKYVWELPVTYFSEKLKYSSLHSQTHSCISFPGRYLLQPYISVTFGLPSDRIISGFKMISNTLWCLISMLSLSSIVQVTSWYHSGLKASGSLEMQLCTQ